MSVKIENIQSEVAEVNTIENFEPGIYFGLPNEKYHASNGISKSGLMLFADNPEKYHWRYILGNKQEARPQFAVGSAFHTATLEPDKFDEEYIVAPDLNKNTNLYKAWVVENADRTILSIKDYDMVMSMAKKVRKNPITSRMISNGYAEASIYAIDEITGETVKVRPDWINDDIIVDLKSTTNASFSAFARDMYSYSYFVQAGMYPEVANAVLPEPVSAFVFIVVEKEPPYSIGIYRASREDTAFGVESYRRNLDRFAKYKAKNFWPSYNRGLIVDTALPGYAKKTEMQEDLSNY